MRVRWGSSSVATLQLLRGGFVFVLCVVVVGDVARAKRSCGGARDEPRVCFESLGESGSDKREMEGVALTTGFLTETEKFNALAFGTGERRTVCERLERLTWVFGTFAFRERDGHYSSETSGMFQGRPTLRPSGPTHRPPPVRHPWPVSSRIDILSASLSLN